MKAPVLVLALLVALTGCLSAGDPKLETYKDRTVTAVLDSGVAPANRTADQFYVVWIHGVENAKRIGGKGDFAVKSCEAQNTVQYDAASSTLRYDEGAHALSPTDLQILIALEYGGERIVDGALGFGCATQSALTGSTGRAQFQRGVRPDLAFELIVEPQNGFLSYDSQDKEYYIPMGKKVHVNLTRVEKTADGHSFYVTGDFEIVNLGLWTVDRLAPYR